MDTNNIFSSIPLEFNQYYAPHHPHPCRLTHTAMSNTHTMNVYMEAHQVNIPCCKLERVSHIPNNRTCTVNYFSQKNPYTVLLGFIVSTTEIPENRHYSLWCFGWSKTPRPIQDSQSEMGGKNDCHSKYSSFIKIQHKMDKRTPLVQNYVIHIKPPIRLHYKKGYSVGTSPTVC